MQFKTTSRSSFRIQTFGRVLFAFAGIVFLAGVISNDAMAQGTKSRRSSSQAEKILVLSPRGPIHHQETHAAMLLSKATFGSSLHFSGRVQTAKQLRRGSSPNPWECAWIVWHYTENHFYYVVLKENGWEVGRHDPTVKGGQIFLRTGEQSFPLNKWHEFDIVQNNDEISIRVDDVEITRFIDRHPLTSGRVGFYTEDAEIWIDNVKAPFVDNFDRYTESVTRKDGSTLTHWMITYLGHGFAAIRSRH